MSDFANYGALQTLVWVMTGTGTPPSGGDLYIKLHTGDPGAEGTDNAAANTTRIVASFAAPTNIGTDGRAQAVTDTDIVWLSVPAKETYSHISVWDSDASGNCWYKGALVAPVPVTTGGNFVLPAGSTIDHV